MVSYCNIGNLCLDKEKKKKGICVRGENEKCVINSADYDDTSLGRLILGYKE